VAWARPTDLAALHGILAPTEITRLSRSRLAPDVQRRVTARALLRLEVAAWMGTSPEEVRFRSRCRHCGDDHGKPIALPVDEVRAPHVSVAHCADLVVVALTDAGPVGVDAEVAGAAGFDRFDDVAMHSRERATTAADRTRLWARKESVLKATGHGLMLDPRNLRVTPAHEEPRLVAWEGGGRPKEPVWMFDVDADEAHLMSVSVVSKRRPKLTVRAEVLAALRETTSR
jgi:4'-phosphopantetheinyl transferase